MASDLNKVILIGRLTRDPETRTTQGGTSVCSFSIANNRTYTTGGEKKEQVSFFNCVAWGKPSEIIAEYMRKGQQIAVEGRLQQRSYDDKDGNKRSVVEIVVDNFQFLSRASGGTSEQGQDNPFSGDEIPFD